MSTPKKPHKKRADKYEPKVGINTDFENALRILGTPIIKKTQIIDNPSYYANLFSGEFELTKDNPAFPPFEHSLFANKFKKISIELESKDAICSISISITNANGDGKVFSINTDKPNVIVKQEYKITDLPFISFKRKEINENGSCYIKFKFS